MADDNNQNMVLRSIYLPPDMDRRLKAFALSLNISKGEATRCLIDAGLSKFVEAGTRGLNAAADSLAGKLKDVAEMVTKPGELRAMNTSL